MSGLLFHIYQKEKIALEIAAKVASVNGPLVLLCGTINIRDLSTNQDMFDFFSVCSYHTPTI